MRAVRGFTLLELLIAIAIFALLGLGTYRMLDSVLQTDKVTRAHELQLRELVRALAAFERDVLQVQATREADMRRVTLWVAPMELGRLGGDVRERAVVSLNGFLGLMP